MLIALVRAVPPTLGECELTHLERHPIDVARAIAQHAAYTGALESLGCAVREVGAAPELPDSVFIEDTAVVLPELAVITRPGAESRRPEFPPVAAALGAYRPLLHIEAPGTLDGGDVLVVGRRVFVGMSGRSNPAAVRQLADRLERHGYAVTGVPVHGCLHLKSAVTALDDRTVLIDPRCVDRDAFGDLDQVEVDPVEALAANALRVGGRILFPAAFPRTAERLAARGFAPMLVEADELARAEGALTCCSLIFEDT